MKYTAMTATSPSGKSNRLGAATRARIIDAAIAVLGEKGFPGFTLQAVADRADVFYGNVTHHYATRDKLIAAMLETILDRYRLRYDELAEQLKASPHPFRMLVTWLIDDSVAPETAPIFLELWANARHAPEIAKALIQLYDNAVGVCLTTLEIPVHSDKARRLRDSLYLLGTVLEGTSSIFYNRNRDDGIYEGFRREAIEMLVSHLDERLAEARSDVA